MFCKSPFIFTFHTSSGVLNVILSFLQQHRLEHIYLSYESLNSQDHMTSDVSEYLKFQAERGNIKSQV